MNLSVTDSAVKRFKENLSSKPDAIGLRISIKSTGCNGYSYVLDYAGEVADDDNVLNVSDISIVVDSTTIDISETFKTLSSSATSPA